MSIHKVYRLLFVFALLVGMAGCGGSSYTPILTSISITPSPAYVEVNGEQQFTAVAQDQKGKTMSDVTFAWSVDPAGIGSITEDGLFTAGATTGSGQVVCTAEGVTNQAAVEVYTSTVTNISITPSSADLAIGDTQQFTAVAQDQGGKTMSGIDFIWSVVPEKGSITSGGLFTAEEAGSCSVIATAGGVTGQALVKISDPAATPSPTYSLVTLGGQIVDDSRRVGGTIETIINNKFANIFENIEQQLVPRMPAVGTAMELNIENITWAFDWDLFYITPGDYGEEEELGDPGDTLQTGTWTFSWEDSWYYEGEVVKWTTTYTRNTEGTNDIITCTSTNEYDPELEHQVTLTFPTALWDDMGEPLDVEGDVEIILTDSVLANATVSGELDLDLAAKTAIINGELDFRFKDSSDFLKYTGDISIQLNKDEEDHLTGVMETADLKITGDIRISYTENTNITEFGVFPASLSMDGEIRTKDTDPVVLDGLLSLEVGNAATYNPGENYSEDNWLQGKATFSGLIQGSNDYGIECELSAEETAFDEIIVTNVAYKLTDGGVAREITIVGTKVSGTVLGIEINSTWGPARIEMTVTFADGFREKPTDATGTVEIAGEEVGTISLTAEGLLVEYIDDTEETF